MSELLEKYGFEKGDSDADSPGFPKPIKKFRLIWERYFASIEEPYFFVLSTMRDSLGWTDVDKIKDIFSASETSAFYGSIGSRLALAQDRVAQYSASIGKFLTELFKMVRELRVIDQRIKLQDDATKGDKAADKALKGIWTDLVEQGAKNPSSVIGLSREVGFTILPDLFFGTYVKKSDDVHSAVKDLKFNEKIKEVLARKLKSYMVWKEKTYEEWTARQSFLKKYIKQYFLTIKMYMNWLRPYMTHIKRLGMDESKLNSPDLIAGFETSMTELELLFKKKDKKSKHHSIISVHFLFKTQPKMEFHQDGYQHRGPIHVGRVIMTFRGFVWTDEQLEEYKKYRKEEDFELLATINEEINAAMNTLSSDIKNYLLNIGETTEEEEKLIKEFNIDQAELSRWQTSYKSEKDRGYKKSLKEYIKENKEAKGEKLELTSVFDPFKHLANGFSEMITGRDIFKFKESTPEKRPTKAQVWLDKQNEEKAKEKMLGPLWTVYEIFKKAHGMLAW